MTTGALRYWLAALCVCACSGQPSTSVMLTVVPAEGVEVEQLKTCVETSAGEEWGPVWAPEKPLGALQGTQTLRLLLPATLKGQTIAVNVEGLKHGDVLAQGKSIVRLVQLQEAAMTVALHQVEPTADRSPTAIDAGHDAGTTMPPDAGLGANCTGCSAQLADGCSATSQCTCGASTACAMGQQCVNGQCICNAPSCDGCCSKNVCWPGDQPAACGVGGMSCQTCGPDEANACANGECRCGTQPACGSGQRCSESRCVCDKNSCPHGCCQAGVCHSGNSDQACGQDGKGCDVCMTDQHCHGKMCKKN
ncbi:MAG: hypothetical protein K1X64_10190 [Myxococcaceae bacterium]|nr:hypothetical protein [Myxococcaceae bacterium]